MIRDEVRDRILTEGYYVIDHVVNLTKHWFPKNYEDELHSFLSVAYVECYPKWNPDVSSWTTYVNNVLRSRAKNHLVHLTKRKRAVSPFHIDSLDETFSNDEDELLERHETIADNRITPIGDEAEAEDIIDQVFHHLRNDRDAPFVLEFLQGKNYIDIMQSTGVSMKTVYRIKDRLAKKLMPLYIKHGGSRG